MSTQSNENLEKSVFPQEIERSLGEAAERLHEAKEEISRAVLGQDAMVEAVIMTLISGGHMLIEGVPGLGKTALALSVSKVFGLSEKRITFHNEMMPSDIQGHQIMETDKESGMKKYRFMEGPVFTQFLIADEINRGNTRTQAALLEALQEKSVTIDGTTFALPMPFHVIATQNPHAKGVTYPLPEAQLDRFLMKLIVGYPDRESERKIMLGTTGTSAEWHDIAAGLKAGADDKNRVLTPPKATLVNPADLKTVFNSVQLIALQHAVRKIPLGKDTADAILDIVRNARPENGAALSTAKPSDLFAFVSANVEEGPGTRALQALSLAARARALLDGRLRATFDDVAAMADPVLRHRLSLGIGAQIKEIDEKKVIERLVKPFSLG